MGGTDIALIAAHYVFFFAVVALGNWWGLGDWNELGGGDWNEE